MYVIDDNAYNYCTIPVYIAYKNNCEIQRNIRCEYIFNYNMKLSLTNISDK